MNNQELTDEQRQALIADCKAEIEKLKRQQSQWPEETYSYTYSYTTSALRRQEFALAALTAEPVRVPDDNLARQAFEKHVRTHYQYPMLERHSEGDGLRAGEYKESSRQMEWEDWLSSKILITPHLKNVEK